MKEFLWDVPDVLYKYRDWGNPKHARLLTDQELYFASIDQFNDPFDGAIPHRYNLGDLTEDNIFLKYREMTIREHPDWDERRIQDECWEFQHHGLFHDVKYLEDFEKRAYEGMKKQFGVVCLCKHPDNFLLWSHYAASHTGICVGFDKHLLWKDSNAQFAHMIYQEKLPRLGLFDNVFEHFTKLIGTKARIWEYEDEYRLTKAEFARGKATLGKETIVEVILGCRMPEEKRLEMVRWIGEKFPHARVYEMVLSSSDFLIERLQVR